MHNQGDVCVESVCVHEVAPASVGDEVVATRAAVGEGGQSMEWEKATKSGDNKTYAIPQRWLHVHYYEALNILFRVENSLRVFVFAVLKNTLFDQWANINISTEDSDGQKTISVVAKRRANQAKGFGYLGYQVACPIMYLTGGELSRLITSDEYWKHFAGYFKGSKEIIRTKLDEISHIRNALAHFRPISEDDVEVIRQNAKQSLAGVEPYLKGMVVAGDIVPTNTEGQWYKDLDAVEIVCAQHDVTFVRRQSAGEKWIHLELTFPATIFSMAKRGSTRYGSPSRLKTSAILESFPEIAKYVTHLSEEGGRFRTSRNIDSDVTISKECTFVFFADTLEKNAKSIAGNLVKLVELVAEETALVGGDNLARGTLVSTASIHGTFNEEKSSWTFNAQTLACPVGEEDSPEYWGNLDLAFVDFIAGAKRYPWMSADISEPGWDF